MNTAQNEVATSAAATPAVEAPARTFRTRAPRVDVSESADAYFVTADVPGVPMNAIEVTIEEDRLELSAKRTVAEHEGYRTAFRQFGEGDYRRAFTIPEAIDREGVRADLRDGVLRITIPKAQPAKPQKIRISAG